MPDLSTCGALADYEPQEGDVVVFPDAPMAVNRTMRYVITGTGRRISFRPEDESRSRVGSYLYTVDELRAIGMRKADPDPVPDPAPGPVN